MRWLFLFVLSLNLAYVGWQVSQSPDDSYAGIKPLQDVKPVVLLSEVKAQVVDEKVADNLEIDESSQLATTASDKDPRQKIEKAAKTTTPEPLEINKAAAIVEQKKVVSKKQDPPEAPRAQCFEMGPFRVLDKLSGLTQEIKPYVVATNFRSLEKSEPTVYWVFIKPEKSHKKAVQVGKRLKAKKIKDFYVIRDGDKVNGLSLGHFRSKEGAYRLTKKVKNLGFNVEVEPVYKSHTLYWLDYQLAAGKKIPASVFEKYMKSTQKEEIIRSPRNCEG